MYKVKLTDSVLKGSNHVQCKLPNGRMLNFNRGFIDKSHKCLEISDVEMSKDVAMSLVTDGYELNPNPLTPKLKKAAAVVSKEKEG